MAKKEKDKAAESEQVSKTFRITLPHSRREMKSAGLLFKDGVAQTTDATAADICRNLGYKVEEIEA